MDKLAKQAYKRRYYQLNKERIIARNQEYRRKNKERVYAQNCRWRRENKEKIAQQKKRHALQLKMEVLTHYSMGAPCCARCGMADIDVLCIDHIEGGGAAHRRDSRLVGRVAFYYFLRRQGYPGGYQILCYNCNRKKYVLEGK